MRKTLILTSLAILIVLSFSLSCSSTEKTIDTSDKKSVEEREAEIDDFLLRVRKKGNNLEQEVINDTAKMNELKKEITDGSRSAEVVQKWAVVTKDKLLSMRDEILQEYEIRGCVVLAKPKNREETNFEKLINQLQNLIDGTDPPLGG